MGPGPFCLGDLHVMGLMDCSTLTVFGRLSSFDAPVVLCVASGSRRDELRVLILPAPQPPRPGFPAGTTSRFQALAARTLGRPWLCTHCSEDRTLEKQILKNVFRLLFPIQISHYRVFARLTGKMLVRDNITFAPASLVALPRRRRLWGRGSQEKRGCVRVCPSACAVSFMRFS